MPRLFFQNSLIFRQVPLKFIFVHTAYQFSIYKMLKRLLFWFLIISLFFIKIEGNIMHSKTYTGNFAWFCMILFTTSLVWALFLGPINL